MKIKALCLLLSIFLTACTQEVKITPQVLPDAVVGQYYDAKIEIEKVTLIDGLFVDSSIPIDSGLKVDTEKGQLPYSGHTIEIKGTPSQSGKYRIVLEGATRNALGGNMNFRKEYDFVIVQ